MASHDRVIFVCVFLCVCAFVREWESVFVCVLLWDPHNHEAPITISVYNISIQTLINLDAATSISTLLIRHCPDVFFWKVEPFAIFKEMLYPHTIHAPKLLVITAPKPTIAPHN